MKKISFIPLCLCFMVSLCFAQTPKQLSKKHLPANIHVVPAQQPGIHEFSFWGGYSFDSNRGVWGKTSGTQLSLFGMRYNRKFLNIPGNKLLEYTLDLNLFAYYRFPDTPEVASHSTSTGFGLAPLGFQFNWRKNKDLQPFVKSSAGFLYLDNPFPDTRGVKFNFTLEVGTGIEIQLTPHSSFTAGYKYHHLSNGETGQVNPGIDSNVFYGAFTFF